MADELEPPSPQRPSYLLDQEPVYLHTCPYLGLLQDRKTALAFPDQANHCHRLQSPVPVDLTHQRSFCLAEEHVRCYVFQQQRGASSEEVPVSPWFKWSLPSLRGVNLLSLPLLGGRSWPQNPFREGFRLPYDFFSGNLTLPPDPWGLESFAIPENPFRKEFALVPLLFHKAAKSSAMLFQEASVRSKARLQEASSTTAVLLHRTSASAGALSKRAAIACASLLRAGVAQTPTRMHEGFASARSTLNQVLVLPDTRIGRWFQPPAELSERPRAYLAFPLMLLLMLLVSLVWRPMPGQDVNLVLAKGEALAQVSTSPLDSGHPASEPLDPVPEPLDSGMYGQSRRESPNPDPLALTTLNSANTSGTTGQPLFMDRVPAAAPVNIADSGPELFALQLRPTEDAPIVATAQAVVLGPQAEIAATPFPTALPTQVPAVAAGPPATPTPLPTAAVIEWVFPPSKPAATAEPAGLPTGEPTALPAEIPTAVPTEPPPVEPTEVPPLPIVDVAYIHTGALNLRSGPGLGYPSLDVAYNREEVYLLGSQGYEPWILIRLASGSEGWVNMKYLVFEKLTG